MKVKCLARVHNAVTRPGLEPGPLDSESSALTIWPQCVPLKLYAVFLNLVSFIKMYTPYIFDLICQF